MEISFQCADRSCTLFHNGQPFSSDEWVDVQSGASVYIRLPVPRPTAGDQDLEPAFYQHFEDLMLMQTQPASLNPNAREFQPGRSPIEAQPEHIQDLLACWERSTFACEDESRVLHVLTWFVAPGVGVSRCLHSKKVTLAADFLQWERQLKEKWIPLLDPNMPTTFVVVQPAPLQIESTISAHVILLQHDLPEQSSPLVTIYDSAVNQGLPFRVVTTVAEQAMSSDILSGLDYTQDCQTVGTSCTIWLERHRLEPRTRIALRDGHCITLQVDRRFLPANWHPPIPPIAAEREAYSLLQTSKRIQQHQPQPDGTYDKKLEKIRFDLHPAIVAFEWIDTHLFLPSYIVPETVHLLPVSRDWADLPIWEIGTPCDSIVVYFDGAFQSQDQKAGLAVAAFVQAGQQWYQAGLISSCVTATESYTPEVFACIVASKLTLDLLKQAFFTQLAPCTIWFGYDSLTVGKQMKGDWKSYGIPLANQHHA